MKRISIFLMGAAVMLVCAPGSFASEKDKGSAMDKGSMMEEGSAAAVTEQAAPAPAESMKKSDSSAWGVAPSARVLIKGTAADSAISGRVDFVETGDGVQAVASLSNVTPAGNHGIHVHENGSCDDGGKAAGGHFNPGKTQHGLLPKDGHTGAHAGDMGNITIDDNGKGSLIVFLPGLSLNKGEKNIIGKAVILHEKEDDFGQPTGNAGGRIGCGIIVLNN